MTFDDGFKDVLEFAAPLLVSLALPFTVFVSTDFAKAGDPRYLSSKELKALAAMPNVQIGAHGKSHCDLTECKDTKLSDELRESRAWLEDLLGREVATMAYPYGAVNRRVRDAALEAGYRLAVSSRFGAADFTADPLMLARVEIHSRDSESIFQAKLEGHWDSIYGAWGWMQEARHSIIHGRRDV